MFWPVELIIGLHRKATFVVAVAVIKRFLLVLFRRYGLSRRPRLILVEDCIIYVILLSGVAKPLNSTSVDFRQ